MSDDVKFISDATQILVRNGFIIHDVESKLKKDIEFAENEIKIMQVVQQFFLENPEKFLEHPAHGLITKSHRFSKKENIASNKQNIEQYQKELKKILHNKKKKEMEGKLEIIHCDDNVVRIK